MASSKWSPGLTKHGELVYNRAEYGEHGKLRCGEEGTDITIGRLCSDVRTPWRAADKRPVSLWKCVHCKTTCLGEVSVVKRTSVVSLVINCSNFIKRCVVRDRIADTRRPYAIALHIIRASSRLDTLRSAGSSVWSTDGRKLATVITC